MADKDTRRTTRLIVGLVLVGLGTLFLLGQILRISLWQFLWPFFVIVPGLLFFVGMTLGGKNAGVLAIPGSIVTAIGLILLYQSVFDHWQSWAYAWALVFPTSLGIGLAVHGVWSGEDRIVREGMGFLRAGIMIFLIAGTFFELVLNISGFRSGLGAFIWPALLIAAGLLLLFGRSGLLPGHRKPSPQAVVVARPDEVHPAEPPKGQ